MGLIAGEFDLLEMASKFLLFLLTFLFAGIITAKEIEQEGIISDNILVDVGEVTRISLQKNARTSGKKNPWEKSWGRFCLKSSNNQIDQYRHHQ
jgi:hypothetical protein